MLKMPQMRQRIADMVEDRAGQTAFAIKGCGRGIFFTAQIDRPVESSIQPGQRAGTETDEAWRRVVRLRWGQWVAQWIHDHLVRTSSRHNFARGVKDELRYECAAIERFADDRLADTVAR